MHNLKYIKKLNILLLDVIKDRDVVWGDPHNPNYLFVMVEVEAGQKNLNSVSLEAAAPYNKKY